MRRLVIFFVILAVAGGGFLAWDYSQHGQQGIASKWLSAVRSARRPLPDHYGIFVAHRGSWMEYGTEVAARPIHLDEPFELIVYKGHSLEMRQYTSQLHLMRMQFLRRIIDYEARDRSTGQPRITEKNEWEVSYWRGMRSQPVPLQQRPVSGHSDMVSFKTATPLEPGVYAVILGDPNAQPTIMLGLVMPPNQTLFHVVVGNADVINELRYTTHCIDLVNGGPAGGTVGAIARGPEAVPCADSPFNPDKSSMDGTGTHQDFEPEMVRIPGGFFMMGNENCAALSGDAWEKKGCPQHSVRIAPFEVSKYEVTFDQWDACERDGGCGGRPDAMPGQDSWGRGSRPVINVYWDDAQIYIAWLRRKTGKAYRLLSEAEWEYAARAGGTGRYGWGDQEPICDEKARNGANFSACPNKRTRPVGSFQPNAFGLYDMHGNVSEWVQDCWNENYSGAPTDGAPWLSGDCNLRVVRGGSWHDNSRALPSAIRGRADPRFRRGGNAMGASNQLGFRVARTP